MKTKLITTVLLASLLLAAPAAAETRHLSGTFRADPDAAISMDLHIRRGAPVSVTNLEFTGLDYECEGSGRTGQMDAELGRATVFTSDRGGFEFDAEPSIPSLDGVVAGGLLNRSASKVKGGVVYFFQDASGATCQSIFDGRYVAR